MGSEGWSAQLWGQPQTRERGQSSSIWVWFCLCGVPQHMGVHKCGQLSFQAPRKLPEPASCWVTVLGCRHWPGARGTRRAGGAIPFFFVSSSFPSIPQWPGRGPPAPIRHLPNPAAPAAVVSPPLARTVGVASSGLPAPRGSSTLTPPSVASPRPQRRPGLGSIGSALRMVGQGRVAARPCDLWDGLISVHVSSLGGSQEWQLRFWPPPPPPTWITTCNLIFTLNISFFWKPLSKFPPSCPFLICVLFLLFLASRPVLQ